MDGELPSSDIGREEDQGDEEDGRSEADQQIRQDELVAETPKHLLAHKPPD